MSAYLLLKTLHVISSTVLFGTGLGTAFFKWSVDRTGSVRAMRIVSERVVLADALFTAPAAVIQPATGLALGWLLGYPFTRGWIGLAIALYCLAGTCWLVVVWLQLRMRALVRVSDSTGRPLSERYWRYARIWFWLGVPAFGALVVVFALMVAKPAWNQAASSIRFPSGSSTTLS